MWALIQFAEDEDYDVIPSSWIKHENKNQCLFPQGGLKYITSLVKNQALPEEDWETREISIIENYIDNYSIALKLMVRAAKSVPLFSDDERGRGLRQKKATRVINEMEMEENDALNEGRDSHRVIEKAKPKNKQKTKILPYPSIPPSYSEVIEHPTSNFQHDVPLSHSNSPQSSTASSHTLPHIAQPDNACVNTTCGIKTKHNCTFEGSDILLVSIAKQLCKLSVDQAKIKAHLKYLREDTNEKVSTQQEQVLVEEDTFLLPIKTEEELHNVELQLGNPTNLAKLIKSLVHQAEGKSVPKVVGSIMTRIITNQLASTYSWKGQKQKKSFQEKELAKAAIAAVLHKFPSEGRQDIIKSMQLWLAQAPTRCKRAQEIAQREEMLTNS